MGLDERDQALVEKIEREERLDGRQLYMLQHIWVQMVDHIETVGSELIRTFRQSSAWTEFESEKLPSLVESHKKLIEILRKHFCFYYSGKISSITREYFYKIAWSK